MGHKVKVLIVSTHPVQYQVPWFRHLHNQLCGFDCEVLYVTVPDADTQGVGFNKAFQWDIPLFDGYNWNKIDNKDLASNKGIDDFLSIRLKSPSRLIKKLRPDAVVLTGWQSLSLIQILYACNRLKIPTLIRGDSNSLKPRKTTTQLLHRQLIKRYDKFLAVGESNKDFYMQNGASTDNIYFCPHFVDNTFFKTQSQHYQNSRPNLREHWSIPQAAFCYCFVGKLAVKKRIMDILKAYKMLCQNTDTAHLLIVGDGELMAQAKDYTTQNNLNVSFTGFLNQSQISKAYAVSDCLLLASDYDETWGLVVNEAMACGVPAIVSDRCGCHLDLIDEGQTGLLFEFGRSDELALKMKQLSDMPAEQYNLMSARCEAKISADYSIENATIGLQKALNDL